MTETKEEPIRYTRKDAGEIATDACIMALPVVVTEEV